MFKALLAPFTGKLWKIATGASLLVSAGLGVALLMEKSVAGHLRSEVARLNAAIDDPITGYLAQIWQHQQNEAALTGAINRQNDSLAKLEADAKLRTQQTADALKQLKAAEIRADKLASAVLNVPIVNVDECEAVKKIDDIFVESLK